jgi:hypothetical protein
MDAIKTPVRFISEGIYFSKQLLVMGRPNKYKYDKVCAFVKENVAPYSNENNIIYACEA